MNPQPPTLLVAMLRDRVNKPTDAPDYDVELELKGMKLLFNELDRALSMGQEIPRQWERIGRSYSDTEDEIEYWRGR